MFTIPSLFNDLFSQYDILDFIKAQPDKHSRQLSCLVC